MKFNLTTDKSSYRIDFTLEGKRKRFYPGTKDETTARQLIKRMAYEWESGQFDLSLEAYKLRNQSQPKAQTPSKEKEAYKTLYLLALWDKWVESLHLPSSTKNGHYHYVRQTIKKYNPQASDALWFVDLRSVWSSSTWLSRKGYIKACVDWATEEGLFFGKNPYQGLKPLKSKAPDTIKPFSAEEISQILEALDSNNFCHPSSRFKHSHYSSFVRFLFITGCRLGEATGLTWNCVDFDTRTIAIRQALGKDITISPNKTRKILKETKTGKVHYIPMNEALLTLLETLFISLGSTEGCDRTIFVFKGQRGKYIDTAGFRRRVWKPILEKLGIDYRYPYQTRHTCLSNVVSSHGLLAAAKLAGHQNLDMVSRHYAKYTGNLVDTLPNLPLRRK